MAIDCWLLGAGTKSLQCVWTIAHLLYHFDPLEQNCNDIFYKKLKPFHDIMPWKHFLALCEGNGFRVILLNKGQ